MGYPIDNIIDYAADVHHEDPSRLAQMAVLLRDPSSMPGHSGAMKRIPEVMAGLLRYPIIDLAITPQTSAKALNATMHHEMRHVFQARVEKPLYYQERALKITRISRQVGLAVGLLLAAKGITDVFEYADHITQGIEQFENSSMCLKVAEVLTGFGMTSVSGLSTERRILWRIDRLERDAEKYVRQHCQYKPITAS